MYCHQTRAWKRERGERGGAQRSIACSFDKRSPAKVTGCQTVTGGVVFKGGQSVKRDVHCPILGSFAWKANILTTGLAVHAIETTIPWGDQVGLIGDDGYENRTRNLLIWSQTRYHCTNPPCRLYPVTIMYITAHTHWGPTGIEPVTSRTQSENHTTRPGSLTLDGNGNGFGEC